MNIYDFTEEKLRQYFISKGENPAKAKIMINNLYKKRITDFNDISEFGNKIKMMLKSDFSIEPLNLVSKTSCPDTHKFLFELCDGHTIESVLMKHDYGNGICISSQVGCNMNCAFCESGKLKKVRNLTPGEMIQQILEVEKITNESISNIAIMGIGEPFDNYENIIGFTEIAANQSGLGFGYNKITISTCGIVPKIIEYSKRETVCNLAISLHAPNNSIRNEIMPINKKYPIEQLIDAVQQYTESNNKKATFAYIMLKGVNDSDECAYKLCNLIKDIRCYVNLIPYNKTSSSCFDKSDKDRISSFYDILKKHNINVIVRREFGSELQAACGQLKASKKD